MKITTVLRICVLLTVCLLGVQSFALAAPERVAIIPFQINAEQDYTFLQKGIVDMLSSRLSSPTVEVIDPLTTAKVLEEVKAFKGDSMVLMAAAKLKADLAIRGSITVLGGSVSIDAKVLDVTGTRPALTFFKQTRSMDEVIPEINRLATEINTKVLGRAAPAPIPQPQQPTPAPAAAAPAVVAPQAQQDIHMHPEKLLQNGRLSEEGGGSTAAGSAPQGKASPLNPAFIEAAGQSQTGKAAFWKSRNYKLLFNGLDVGDVNGDGRLETVVATPQSLMIFQNNNNQLQSLKEIKTDRYARNIGVDIADINGNGTPEIFITALNSQLNTLSSIVMEYDGRDYKTIDDSRWYYRVVHHSTEGTKLYGQQQMAGQNNPFSSPIYELSWKGGEYVPGTKLLPGRKANLLGAAVGDIMNDGRNAVVAFDPSDHLRVIQTDGTVEWTGAEYYGGSPLYFSRSGTGPGESSIPFYLPIRIRIADLNKTGKYQAIVAQNVDTAGRKLASQRFYKQSKIAALQWNGLGLVPMWQTAEIPGRIQDIAIADFDNDGVNELIAAVVSAEGAIIGSDPKSTIIAYELNQVAK